VTNDGLPLNETTAAEFLKTQGYATGIMGKWHLGQRHVYLPASRGFDEYLGIPYSDDMGRARATKCNISEDSAANAEGTERPNWHQAEYVALGVADPGVGSDPAGDWLPLVSQGPNGTKVVEQPLDLTTLASKYTDFVTSFVERHQHEPFFLYMPFSHVHTTDVNQPEQQYAGCAFKNATKRGSFGDALAEVDYQVENLLTALSKAQLSKNTLILFAGDNGPWMIRGSSAGSPGVFYGRDSGYWNVGKGSTWEGGIHEAAFAYWPGQILAQTRSTETVSSLDFLPTLYNLLGVPLPSDRVFDGRDMSAVLFDKGPSKHDVLFFYGANDARKMPSAARYGKYKAHWVTAPGLGGCKDCLTNYYPNPPLLFDVLQDPSEAYPLTQNNTQPTDPGLLAVVEYLQKAFVKEVATFTWGKLVPVPDQPGEGPDLYGVCCDRAKACNCNGI
jgi:arylsulfatase A